MKELLKDLPDVVVLIAGLFVIIIAFLCLGLTFYGIYLAFSASILLGFVSLLIEPWPLIFGAAMFFFDTNLPLKIMELF